MLCADLNGEEIQKRRALHITNSFCYTAETNIRLKSNYTPIDIKKSVRSFYFRTITWSYFHHPTYKEAETPKLLDRSASVGKLTDRWTDGQSN